MRCLRQEKNKIDRLHWIEATNGEYTVKRKNRLLLGEVHAKRVKEYWKSWWSMRLPPTLLIFRWRIANNGLPTAENLFARGIKIDRSCQLCNKEDESISHFLTECEVKEDLYLVFAIIDFLIGRSEVHLKLLVRLIDC